MIISHALMILLKIARIVSRQGLAWLMQRWCMVSGVTQNTLTAEEVLIKQDKIVF
jgi:hypothetical protein